MRRDYVKQRHDLLALGVIDEEFDVDKGRLAEVMSRRFRYFCTIRSPDVLDRVTKRRSNLEPWYDRQSWRNYESFRIPCPPNRTCVLR